VTASLASETTWRTAGSVGWTLLEFEGVAVSDTPIYDQLRRELTSERGRQERAVRARQQAEPSTSRRERDESSAPSLTPATRIDSGTRRTVSVWSLVNRDK